MAYIHFGLGLSPAGFDEEAPFALVEGFDDEESTSAFDLVDFPALQRAHQTLRMGDASVLDVLAGPIGHVQACL